MSYKVRIFVKPSGGIEEDRGMGTEEFGVA